MLGLWEYFWGWVGGIVPTGIRFTGEVLLAASFSAESLTGAAFTGEELI